MALFPRYDGGALIEQVVSIDNLTLAWRRVRSNIKLARRNHSAGPDAVTLHDFEADWSRQMAQLADELRYGSYRPLSPRRVQIRKRDGGERAIAILAVRDRIAQRAVQQVLEPLFEPFLLDCAYGCRPSVGVADAVARVSRYAEQGLTWVVDADIAGYFDAIDQRILLSLVRQRVADDAILQLITQWLAAGSLNTSDATPLTPTPDTPLEHARAFVERAMHADVQPVASIFDGMSGMTDDTWPGYHATPSEPNAPWFAQAAGMEQKLWTALSLARPAMEGARHALPYLQRIGGRRLAVAGAVATGVLAASEVVMRHQRAAERRGTAQGGPLSPLLANIYLHPFDVAVTGRGFRLVRFVDDFVVMCASSAEAEAAHLYVEKQLHKLRLELHPDKTRIQPYADGLDFLGQSLAPRRPGPLLAAGAATFTEAEQALRAAATSARQRFKRR